MKDELKDMTADQLEQLLEQKRAEEILKTPLEKFGDQDVEDLAEKYENQDS